MHPAQRCSCTVRLRHPLSLLPRVIHVPHCSHRCDQVWDHLSPAQLLSIVALLTSPSTPLRRCLSLERQFADAEEPAASCASPTGSLFAAHREVSITHHQHTMTPCLHPQTWLHLPVRPSRSTPDQVSQNVLSHALSKLRVKHIPNPHLSAMDKQQSQPHLWQHQAQHSPSSSQGPNKCPCPMWCWHCASKQTGLCSKQLRRQLGSPGSHASVSLPASPAAALHPAELTKCSDTICLYVPEQLL